LAECRKRGWIAQVVERRILFGCIDIIALVPPSHHLLSNGQIIGIQATSGTNHAARITKSRAEPRLAAWLGAGATFAVWSWSKKGPRGKRKVWMLRETRVEQPIATYESLGLALKQAQDEAMEVING
jgi:hypothetical protein